MASTVPGAKAAMIAAIKANSAITTAGTPVLWGEPTKEGDYKGKTEAIWLGDVDQTEEWPGITQRRDEDYTVGVVIRVIKRGNDEKATEERAWALRDEVAAAMTTVRPSYIQAEIERTTQRNTPTDDAWFTDLTLTVRIRAISVQ